VKPRQLRRARAFAARAITYGCDDGYTPPGYDQRAALRIALAFDGCPPRLADRCALALLAVGLPRFDDDDPAGSIAAWGSVPAGEAPPDWLDVAALLRRIPAQVAP
jgi:hypothetical protein